MITQQKDKDWLIKILSDPVNTQLRSKYADELVEQSRSAADCVWL